MRAGQDGAGGAGGWARFFCKNSRHPRTRPLAGLASFAGVSYGLCELCLGIFLGREVLQPLSIDSPPDMSVEVVCRHVCRYVRRHVCSKTCVDVCEDVCADMCVDMCAGVCAGVCRDMCAGVCAGVCADMCAGVCVDMCRDMRAGVCGDMCRGMCRSDVPQVRQHFRQRSGHLHAVRQHADYF